MSKKLTLDQYELDIETNLEQHKELLNVQAEMDLIKSAAKSHARRKKPVTLRVSEQDIEIMRIKASKLGIPYQTYINMLIHKDASTL